MVIILFKCSPSLAVNFNNFFSPKINAITQMFKWIDIVINGVVLLLNRLWICNVIFFLVYVFFIFCSIQFTIGLSILLIFSTKKLSVLLIMSFAVVSVFINLDFTCNSLSLLSFVFVAVFQTSWTERSLAFILRHPLLLLASRCFLFLLPNKGALLPHSKP